MDLTIVVESSDEEDCRFEHHVPHSSGLSNIRRHFNQVRRPTNDLATLAASSHGAAALKRSNREPIETLPVKRIKQDIHVDRAPIQSPVELIEDDDEHPQSSIRQALRSTKDPSADSTAPNVVDLTNDDYMTDAQIRSFIRRLSKEEDKAAEAKLNERIEISSYNSDNPRFRCIAGKSVELATGSTEHDREAFLYIKQVLRDGHGRVFLAGYKLVRQNYLGSMMARRRNDLVLVRQVPEGTQDPWSVLHEVSIGDVVKNRHIVFTNALFPHVSAREDAATFADPTQTVESGPLFCRWTYTTIVDNRRRSIEDIVEHLDAERAQDVTRKTLVGGVRKARIPNDEVRFQWRGIETVLGGSNTARRRHYNLDGTAKVEAPRAYTYADAFCGAGGTSRGASEAGLKLRWAFDKNKEAINSYEYNFGRSDADCRHESVDEFLSYVMSHVEKENLMVDILHISPPCQPFSPAHTVASPERDEANQAALPSVWQLVETLKPRVVSIEETEGLFSRHREWFCLLINTFTSLGYSVRWKVIQCHSYGVPQTRKRLIIVASGPGEKLPPFPQPTHDATDHTRLKPLTTINGTISKVPLHAADHDQTIHFETGVRPPFDGNIQAKTVTTNAGQGNYHPSGLRPFTLRELAHLQTFPLYHSFAGAKGVTEKRRQIGNAVPPVLAKAIFKAIIKSLKESDGV